MSIIKFLNDVFFGYNNDEEIPISDFEISQFSISEKDFEDEDQDIYPEDNEEFKLALLNQIEVNLENDEPITFLDHNENKETPLSNLEDIDYDSY